MKHLSAILFAFFVLGASPVGAADPNQIFGTILGEINRQIERSQQKKQAERLRPLWTACSKGDLAACDRAARFPNLTDEARTAILRMREAAAQRPAYERNFYACQKMNRYACAAALDYPFASDVDRTNLQNWQRAANQQHQQSLDAFDRNERSCFGGSVAACEAALTQRHINETAATGIESQRRNLMFAEEQRQLRERQALAQFRQHERNCYSGSVAACDAAIAQRQLDSSAASRIEIQRTQLLFAQEQRQLKERQRQAAVRDYTAHRDACAAGQRAACLKAAAHPQVAQADIAFLNQRERELSSITERVANFVKGATTTVNGNGGDIGIIALALLGSLMLIGGAVGTRRILRKRVAPAGVDATNRRGSIPRRTSNNRPT